MLWIYLLANYGIRFWPTTLSTLSLNWISKENVSYRNMEEKTSSNRRALRMNKCPIEILLQVLKMLTGCLEIAFLNVMGFESFNHVMNVYFFPIYLLLVEMEWWTFPLTFLSMCVFATLVGIVIWQYKTSCVGADRQSNPSFKELPYVTIISTKMQNRGWQNDWFYLYFRIFFLWMAVPENTIVEIK